MSTANVRKFPIFIPLDVLNSQHGCFIRLFLFLCTFLFQNQFDVQREHVVNYFVAQVVKE